MNYICSRHYYSRDRPYVQRAEADDNPDVES
jgi:hypothetical protein